jgi:hypothetical protein
MGHSHYVIKMVDNVSGRLCFMAEDDEKKQKQTVRKDLISIYLQDGKLQWSINPDVQVLSLPTLLRKVAFQVEKSLVEG